MRKARTAQRRVTGRLLPGVGAATIVIAGTLAGGGAAQAGDGESVNANAPGTFEDHYVVGLQGGYVYGSLGLGMANHTSVLGVHDRSNDAWNAERTAAKLPFHPDAETPAG